MKKHFNKLCIISLVSCLLGAIPLITIATLLLSVRAFKRVLPSERGKVLAGISIGVNILYLVIQVVVLMIYIFSNPFGEHQVEQPTEILTETVTADVEDGELTPEVISEVVAEEMTDIAVEESSEVVTVDTIHDMPNKDAASNSDSQAESSGSEMQVPNYEEKKPDAAIPEIGEYETFAFWGGYREDTYNGY